MSLLSRDQILSADDLKTEDVVVPEWGGAVRVRTMTGKERDAFGNSLPVADDGTTDTSNYRAALLSHTIVDEGGALVFTQEDVVALGKKSAAAIFRVFSVADRLNIISNNSVTEMEKNSAAAPSGDSTSASA